MVTLTTTGRTDTQIYSSGTRRPFVPPMPDLDTADANPRAHHDAMLDLASNALRYGAVMRTLCGSDAHVRELCATIERLDCHDQGLADRVGELEAQLAIAQGLAATADRRLSECRGLLAEAQELRTAALADAEQQRGNAIRLADQVCALIRPPREPVVVHVADLVPPSGRPRVDPPGRCVAAYTAPSDWDTSDLDTVVCDMPMESL